MQYGGSQYSQGAAPSHHPPQYAPPEVLPGNGSSTSSLRQWRKKDSCLEKQAISSDQPAVSVGESSTHNHIARVAPHSHYPRPTNELDRYPHQYADYNVSYKPPAPVKYSEIVETQPSQRIEHIQKPKGKEYIEMCSVPQSHMKQYPDHLNSNLHQYIQKESQMPSYVTKEPQMHQYMQKEHQYQQYLSNKYSMQSQYQRSYPSEPNNFLAHLNKINPRMAQNIINDPHIRDHQVAMYHGLEQRSYPQPQRVYGLHNGPNYSQPPLRNVSVSQAYNYSPSYNYNIKHNVQPDHYARMHPYQHGTKFPQECKINNHMEQPPRNISPRRTYTENMGGINYGPMPPKMSPNYPQCSQLEYAQHYQHRRAHMPQEFYSSQGYKTSYIPNPQISPDMSGDSRSTKSNSLKQFLETWVDEDMIGNLSEMVVQGNALDSEKLQFLKGPIRLKDDDGSGQHLYVLDSTEITSENLPQFMHLAQFDKLPEDIRGFYHSVEKGAAISVPERIVVDTESSESENGRFVLDSGVAVQITPMATESSGDKVSEKATETNSKNDKTTTNTEAEIAKKSEPIEVVRENVIQNPTKGDVDKESNEPTSVIVDAVKSVEETDRPFSPKNMPILDVDVEVGQRSETENFPSDEEMCIVYKEMEKIHGVIFNKAKMEAEKRKNSCETKINQMETCTQTDNNAKDSEKTEDTIDQNVDSSNKEAVSQEDVAPPEETITISEQNYQIQEENHIPEEDKTSEMKTVSEVIHESTKTPKEDEIPQETNLEEPKIPEETESPNTIPQEPKLTEETNIPEETKSSETDIPEDDYEMMPLSPKNVEEVNQQIHETAPDLLPEVPIGKIAKLPPEPEEVNDISTAEAEPPEDEPEQEVETPLLESAEELDTEIVETVEEVEEFLIEDDKSDEEEVEERDVSNVQYETRNAIKIDENNILLQIADELLEINVMVHDGQKIITVKNFSNAPIVNEEATSINEEASSENEEVPIDNEEASSDNEEAAIGNAEVPTDNEEVPDNEEVTMNNEEVPIQNEEVLINNEEVPMNNEEISLVNEEVQIVDEEAPIVNEPPLEDLIPEERICVEGEIECDSMAEIEHEVVVCSNEVQEEKTEEVVEKPEVTSSCVDVDKPEPKLEPELEKIFEPKCDESETKPKDKLIENKLKKYKRIITRKGNSDEDDFIKKIPEPVPVDPTVLRTSMRTKAALKRYQFSPPPIEPKRKRKISEKSKKDDKDAEKKSHKPKNKLREKWVQDNNVSSQEPPRKPEGKVCPKREEENQRKANVRIKMYNKKSKIDELNKEEINRNKKRTKPEAEKPEKKVEEVAPKVEPAPKVAKCCNVVERPAKKNIHDVQEKCISSTSDRIKVQVKKVGQFSNDWEMDQEDLTSSPQKRRLSLQEYNNRKSHLSEPFGLLDFIKKDEINHYHNTFHTSAYLRHPNTNQEYFNVFYKKSDPPKPDFTIQLQLPKKERTEPISENDLLMKRFLNREKLTKEELNKVKDIITYKRLLSQINGKLKFGEQEYEIKKSSPLDETPPCVVQENFKIHLKKVPERRRRKRFRNLYSDADSESDGEFKVPGRLDDDAVEGYSVYQSKSRVGLPKLIIKRRVSEFRMQPYVRIERRPSIDARAKMMEW